MNTPIYFYLPTASWPNGSLPKSVESNCEIYFLGTHLNWVLQTYLRLKAAGYWVELVTKIPEEGLIVTFSGLIRFDYMPSPRQFLVSISADNGPHFFAQMHVVQNLAQTTILSDSFHIPHWPQPDLIPRKASVGDRFLQAAFFGDETNLACELRRPDWVLALREIGLGWSIRGHQSPKRSDCSDVDLVIAVRSFDKKGYIRKPASKLFNAWLAGVPAVLGNEYAFREHRKSELDYIEVGTSEEALCAVRSLAASPLLRNRMIENGVRRAHQISVSAITERWRMILFEEAVARFEHWRSSSIRDRQRFMRRRKLEKYIRGFKYRLLRRCGQEHNAL